MNIIYCRTSWMKYYDGLDNGDIIENPDGFTREYGWGGYVNNFTNHNGIFFGYVKPPSNHISVKLRFNNYKTRIIGEQYDHYVDDAIVIWVSNDLIVGYYLDAKIHSIELCINKQVAPGRVYYGGFFETNNATLIPFNKRNEHVYIPGQSNVWYGDDKTNERVLRYIENKAWENDNITTNEFTLKDGIEFNPLYIDNIKIADVISRNTIRTVDNEIMTIGEYISKHNIDDVDKIKMGLYNFSKIYDFSIKV